MWLFRFSTRSDWDKVDRYIKKRKFYSTLPHKINEAVNEWHEAQPDLNPVETFKEEGVFGEEGWSISYSHPSFDTDKTNGND